MCVCSVLLLSSSCSVLLLLLLSCSVLLLLSSCCNLSDKQNMEISPPKSPPPPENRCVFSPKLQYASLNEWNPGGRSLARVCVVDSGRWDVPTKCEGEGQTETVLQFLHCAQHLSSSAQCSYDMFLMDYLLVFVGDPPNLGRWDVWTPSQSVAEGRV